MVSATNGLFAHGPYPLAGTLDYPGDPGLFGPGSVTWPVVGDAAVLVGGIRSLLVQAAHPEVVAGVADHSRYREDPLGRLTRTSSYVTATCFGAMPEVGRAVELVRNAHRRVVGRSHRGKPYDAADPGLAAWVHNSMTGSFLAAFQAYGAGARGFSEAQADLFVAEQARVGALLGAAPLPTTARELAEWLAGHPEIGASPGAEEAVRFLRDPPLTPAVRAGYGLLFRAAVATVPERIRQILGVHALPGDAVVGQVAVAAMRWALGGSPDWRLALVRTGAPPPPGVSFRQPLPSRLATGGPSHPPAPSAPPAPVEGA